MKLIDNLLLDELTAKAKNAPRKRAHYTIHSELTDPVQRLCIAMEPGSYVRPHRHADPETWELLTLLRGSLAVLIFDDGGKVAGKQVLSAKGPARMAEFPKNAWHSWTALESGTIVFEVKQGPYKPTAEHNFAPWAPEEGKPGAERFLRWYKDAKAGDMPPKI